MLCALGKRAVGECWHLFPRHFVVLRCVRRPRKGICKTRDHHFVAAVPELCSCYDERQSHGALAQATCKSTSHMKLALRCRWPESVSGAPPQFPGLGPLDRGDLRGYQLRILETVEGVMDAWMEGRTDG